MEENDDGVRLSAKRNTRKPRPTAASRFWNELWHGKRAVNASAHGMLAEVLASCRVKDDVHVVDLKLQIKWATGVREITQHRTVQCLLPRKFEGQVRELWKLCTHVSVGGEKEDFRLRCTRDHIFYEVGEGAVALAMAARGMRVVVEARMQDADMLEQMQCVNGRRACRRMWIRKGGGGSSVNGKCSNESAWGPYSSERFQLSSSEWNDQGSRLKSASKSSPRERGVSPSVAPSAAPLEILYISNASMFWQLAAGGSDGGVGRFLQTGRVANLILRCSNDCAASEANATAGEAPVVLSEAAASRALLAQVYASGI